VSRLIRLVAVLCTASLLARAPAVRADVVPPPPAAEPSPAPALTIPAPEIVTRAEDAKTLMRRVAERATDEGVKNDIEAQLPETSAKLRERTAQADAMLEASATFDALDDLDTEWRAREKRLTGWRLALTQSAKAIEADLALLQQEHALWQRTREAPEAATLPPATLARVSEVIESLTRAEQRLGRQRASILTLQNEVAEEELVVRRVVDRITSDRNELGKQIWQRDAPPLWSPQAYAPSGDVSFLPERMRQAVTRKLDLLREFAGLSISRLELEALFFTLVLGALLAARRRVRAATGAQTDPALAMPTRIFDRPVSAAIVVSIAWTMWLLPRPPGVWSEVEAFVLLIPVLRLLPIELYGDLRSGLLGLSLLFLAGSVRGVFSVFPTVERFLILPETLGAIALLAWLQRPERTRRFGSIRPFGPIVAPAARIALAICVVALVCNSLGLAMLSRLLLRGVLASIYGAVALYALVRFAGGVVTAALRSTAARKLRLVREHGELVRRRLLVIQYWIGGLAWLLLSLRVVGLEDDLTAGVTRVLAARLEIGTVSVSLGNVVAFFLTLWIASQISRFLRFVLDEDVLPRIALPRGVPAAISTGVHYAILAAGALIAIGAAGVDLSKFSLIAGALGVGIGFGLQNVVNNFVSGLILLFERPVQTGDMIEVGGLQGEVKRIGIRSSTVRTFEGADVIVPNASLIADRVVNWTFSDRTRRVDLTVGVAYGSDPSKVLALLIATAKESPEVLSLPEPVAFFTGFGGSSLDFVLRVWCRIELAPGVKSALGIAIHDALRSAGIEIPFPQQDVHLKVEPAAE
jgi:small-conductance mechanosensitive channel